jgi:hypothetical protein
VVTLTVQPQAVPVAEAGSAQVVCGGQPVAVGTPAQPGLSYLWLPDSLTAAQPTVSPTQTTTYTLLVLDTTATCSQTATDTVRVTVVNDPKPVSVFLPDTAICAGTPLTLTPQMAGEVVAVLWCTGDTTTTLTVSPTTTTTYTVTVSGSVCNPPVADTATVTVVPVVPVTAAAGADVVVCPGDSVVVGTPGVPGVSYQWQPGNAVGAQVVVRPATTTAYTVVASVPGPCAASARDTVVVVVRSASDTLCRPTSVAEPLSGSGFILHPNPSQGQLTVCRSGGTGQRVDLLITTVGGQVLVRGHLRPTDRETVLNLESLAAGVYLCRFVHNGANLETHKLVLTR